MVVKAATPILPSYPKVPGSILATGTDREVFSIIFSYLLKFRISLSNYKFKKKNWITQTFGFEGFIFIYPMCFLNVGTFM
jgi:hypothetical protein